jgi:L-seryl-tRNA(Ser) seleniumtransferase
LADLIAKEAARLTAMSLRTVVNGTGVVLHTNLGRSPLAKDALDAISSIASGYSNLELDLGTGQRGSRYMHVEGLIKELTGAESALVVNNNAAAVILALSTLAAGREVIVSRGELVEIGGSFRIPDVMRQSGTTMVEVGTTNRTHLSDYLSRTNEATSLYLKVHTSNFIVSGFTSDVSVSELSTAGKTTGIPVMLDAGSGSFINLESFGIGNEPTIRQYLESGADLVTFSGDKLLGGPQAGIIAGRRELLEPMKKNPLLRAFRIDKLSLAALEATLRLYRDEQQAVRKIPTLSMLCFTADELKKRAGRILRQLEKRTDPLVFLSIIKGESAAGGGTFPLLKLPTWLIEVKISGASSQQVESALRNSSIPVIGRIFHDKYLLDVRTILDSDISTVEYSLNEAALSLRKEG